jgi:hypothetical protein
MPQPFDPNWKANKEAAESGGGGTDLQSLMSVADALDASPKHVPIATDFATLRDKYKSPDRVTVRRTLTDYLLDFLIPLHILVMVYAVVFYLLDVRYVYTSELDQSMRIVALSFVLGVVALNRLIARDGSDESIIYMLGLGGMMGFYTFSTTGLYDAGSVARNFMNSNAYLATAFNMVVVVFLWWLVNRLTHECCVDENRHAGDIGILTGTARNWRKLLDRDAAAKAEPKKKEKKGPEPIFMTMELEAIDPTEFRRPVAPSAPAPRAVHLSDRLAGRHPGMSIFLFAIPVLAIFALGLRVIQHGGPDWVRRGMLFMALYVFTSLSLLMLTSLAGLREYFRSRRIAMPASIGVFWIGLGVTMVITVMIGALNLPLPDLPPLAYIDEHVRDEYDRSDTFQVQQVELSPIDELKQQTFVQRLSNGVLIVLGLMTVYAALKAAGWAAWRALKRRERLPRWLVAFLTAMDATVSAVTRVPKWRPLSTGRVRVSRDIALSANFRNSMGDAALFQRYGPRDHIEHAYSALCALAMDLGVPRQDGETPLEFIARFPKSLSGLKEEAEDLTRLYMVSAYSDLALEDRVLDRLRKFWITYDRLRNRIVR